MKENKSIKKLSNMKYSPYSKNNYHQYIYQNKNQTQSNPNSVKKIKPQNISQIQNGVNLNRTPLRQNKNKLNTTNNSPYSNNSYILNQNLDKSLFQKILKFNENLKNYSKNYQKLSELLSLLLPNPSQTFQNTQIYLQALSHLAHENADSQTRIFLLSAGQLRLKNQKGLLQQEIDQFHAKNAELVHEFEDYESLIENIKMQEPFLSQIFLNIIKTQEQLESQKTRNSESLQQIQQNQMQNQQLEEEISEIKMELNQVKLSLQNFREQAWKIKNILENFNVLNYVSTPAASFWNQIINVFVIPNSINRLIFSNQFFEIVINIQKILLEEMFFLDRQKTPNLLLVSQNDELIKIREKKSSLLENLQQNQNNFIQQDEQILDNISQQITQTELEKQIKYCKEVYFQNIFQISLSFDQLYLNLKNSLLKPNFSLILMEMIQKLSINFKQENTLNQQITATTTSYIQKNKALFEKQQKTKQIVQKMKILNQDITEQEKKISESKEQLIKSNTNLNQLISQKINEKFQLYQRENHDYLKNMKFQLGKSQFDKFEQEKFQSTQQEIKESINNLQNQFTNIYNRIIMINNYRQTKQKQLETELLPQAKEINDNLTQNKEEIEVLHNKITKNCNIEKEYLQKTAVIVISQTGPNKKLQEFFQNNFKHIITLYDQITFEMIEQSAYQCYMLKKEEEQINKQIQKYKNGETILENVQNDLITYQQNQKNEEKNYLEIQQIIENYTKNDQDMQEYLSKQAQFQNLNQSLSQINNSQLQNNNHDNYFSENNQNQYNNHPKFTNNQNNQHKQQNFKKLNTRANSEAFALTNYQQLPQQQQKQQQQILHIAQINLQKQAPYFQQTQIQTQNIQNQQIQKVKFNFNGHNNFPDNQETNYTARTNFHPSQNSIIQHSGNSIQNESGQLTDKNLAPSSQNQNFADQEKINKFQTEKQNTYQNNNQIQQPSSNQNQNTNMNQLQQQNPNNLQNDNLNYNSNQINYNFQPNQENFKKQYYSNPNNQHQQEDIFQDLDFQISENNDLSNFNLSRAQTTNNFNTTQNLNNTQQQDINQNYYNSNTNLQNISAISYISNNQGRTQDFYDNKFHLPNINLSILNTTNNQKQTNQQNQNQSQKLNNNYNNNNINNNNNSKYDENSLSQVITQNSSFHTNSSNLYKNQNQNQNSISNNNSNSNQNNNNQNNNLNNYNSNNNNLNISQNQNQEQFFQSALIIPQNQSLQQQFYSSSQQQQHPPFSFFNGNNNQQISLNSQQFLQKQQFQQSQQNCSPMFDPQVTNESQIQQSNNNLKETLPQPISEFPTKQRSYSQCFNQIGHNHYLNSNFENSKNLQKSQKNQSQYYLDPKNILNINNQSQNKHAKQRSNSTFIGYTHKPSFTQDNSFLISQNKKNLNYSTNNEPQDDAIYLSSEWKLKSSQRKQFENHLNSIYETLKNQEIYQQNYQNAQYNNQNTTSNNQELHISDLENNNTNNLSSNNINNIPNKNGSHYFHNSRKPQHQSQPQCQPQSQPQPQPQPQFFNQKQLLTQIAWFQPLTQPGLTVYKKFALTKNFSVTSEIFDPIKAPNAKPENTGYGKRILKLDLNKNQVQFFKNQKLEKTLDFSNLLALKIPQNSQLIIKAKTNPNYIINNYDKRTYEKFVQCNFIPLSIQCKEQGSVDIIANNLEDFYLIKEFVDLITNKKYKFI